MSRRGVPNLLTEGELAERTKLSMSTLHNLRRPGRPDPIPFYKIGGAVRYDEEDVRKWLERRRCNDSHEAANLTRKGA